MSGDPRERLLGGSLVGRLASLAWPLVLTNQASILSTIVAFYWMSHLVGTNGIAAAGLLDPLLIGGTWLMCSAGAGGTILVTQSIGAGDGRAGTIAASSATLALAMWLVLAAIALPFVGPLAELIGGRAGVATQTGTLVGFWLALVLPITLLAEIAVDTANATGWTRMSVSRVAVDLAFLAGVTPLLMSGLGLGLAGAPVAQAGAACALAFVVVRALRGRRDALGLGARIDRARVIDFALWRKMLGVGLPGQLARTMSFAIEILLLQWVARDGRAAVAGYGAAGIFMTLTTITSMGLAQATSIVVGHAVGAGKFARARAGIRVACLSVLVVMAGFFALSFLGGPIMGILSDDPAVIDAGQQALSILRWGLFGTGLWQVLMNSASATGAPRLAATVTMALEPPLLLILFLVPFESALTAAATASVVREVVTSLAVLAVMPRTLRKAGAAGPDVVSPGG